MLKGKTVAAATLGCKVNQYETDAMLELVKAAGAAIVDFDDRADIYIVNTCSVTNIADKKSRQMLHRARRMNPEAVVVAVGCYVQSAKELLDRDEAIDLVVSNNRKKEIADILIDYINVRDGKVDNFDLAECFTDIAKESEYEELSVGRPVSHTRAYVKIQDGCNQFCSYCIIPYVRGRIRSRSPESVAAEVRALAASGVKEIVLTGIHISSYGKDKKNENGLIELIESIAQIKGIKRIRLGSLEPGIITEEFASRISAVSKVCPHFHLSLQSGCDTVLRRMNRKYNCAEYLEKCDILRRIYDKPAITTDVIVGFPGETDEEFDETVAYLKALSLYEIHVFKYSPRKGTAAAVMKAQVSPEVKNRRSDILLELTAGQKNRYEAQFAGTELEVLVEEVLEKEDGVYLRGHTERYMDVSAYAGSVEMPESFVNSLVYAYLSEDGTAQLV